MGDLIKKKESLGDFTFFLSFFFLMKRRIPQWREPDPEKPPPSFNRRPVPQWHEPEQEAEFFTPRAIHSFLRPTAKPAPHPLARSDSSASTFFTLKSSMPRFRRNRPEFATTTADITEKKQKDTNLLWLQLIFALGTFSNLYASTTRSSYQEQHLEASIKNFNSDAVKRHIQVWTQFEDWCKPLGFHPAGISIQFLLDFLYESSKGINKTRINSHSLLKSLRFVATQADVYNLKQILWSPIVSGYLSETKRPKNPREVFPLPFHFEVALEYYLLNSATPESNKLIFGCFLFQFWSGLRFQDLQRVLLNTLTLQEGVIRCISTLTKNGQPQPAAALACGFCSSCFTTGWGYIWMHLMKKWQTMIAKKAPNFKIDFIFPDIIQEGALDTSLLPRPLPYIKASTIIRHAATQNWMNPPYKTTELPNITVHSTKSSLISAGKQLDLPRHWMQEQGHHRGSRNQTDRYSRDDTLYSLFLQRTISQQVRSGWRPLVAQARGGQAPMALRSFVVPDLTINWPPFLFPSVLQHPDTINKMKAVLPVVDQKEDDSVSDSSTSQESSSSSSDSEILPLENTSFILNCFTRVAHIARFLKDSPHPSPACGRDLGISVELLQVVDSIPADYDLCQHKACSL